MRVKNHPTCLEIFVSPAELRDAVLGVLRQHGVDPEDAAAVYVGGREVLGLQVEATVVLPKAGTLSS